MKFFALLCVAGLLCGCDRVLTVAEQKAAVRACLAADLRPDVIPYGFSRGNRVAAVRCTPWERK
jgi:hypothetical protein